MVNKEEFNRYVEDNIRSTVEEFDLLEKGEKIAIALSGGKDSVLALHILNLFKKEYQLDLMAITIDEGVSGYRNEGLIAAKNNAQKLGVELIEKSFINEFNFKLDDIYSRYRSACIPCGVLRRYLLNKTAYQINASKIVTGHNMDDEIQSFLMSWGRVDFRKFSKFGPKLEIIHPKLVPRIKPLWKVPEKDVGIWAVLNDVEVHFAECPYSNMSARSKMKEYLNNLESKRKGTKAKIFEFFQKNLQFEKKSANLYECEKCGEPSSLNICKACEMIDELNKA